MNLSEQCQNYAELKAEAKQAKAEYEDLEKQRKRAEFDLLERMEQEECDGHKTGAFNYVPQETPFAVVQDRAEFIKWAEANDPELIEPHERKKLLNQEVRKHLDDGKPLPPGLGFYVKRVVSQRAA